MDYSCDCGNSYFVDCLSMCVPFRGIAYGHSYSIWQIIIWFFDLDFVSFIYRG